MPRTARLDAPGVLHHVMIRGIEGRKIFRNKKDRKDLAGGGLVRSMGGWTEVKKDQSCRMSDERILGDSDFICSVLSQADENLNRHYELKAQGYNLHCVAERVS